MELALDLGEAFLPAFDTPTGVPYGAINLLRGVAPDETPIASTAAGGTMILEFGMLSDLTGDQRFRRAAEKALEGLWSRRSELNLVGTHLNVRTGDWTQAESSVGAGVDSFYEYLLKTYILFGDALMSMRKDTRTEKSGSSLAFYFYYSKHASDTINYCITLFYI